MKIPLSAITMALAMGVPFERGEFVERVSTRNYRERPVTKTENKAAARRRRQMEKRNERD